ncbi:MAG: imidazolonepropionase [Granulosicoccus sp.]|nr:imidazolonepropionase [Granulosicoccus sp.]
MTEQVLINTTIATCQAQQTNYGLLADGALAIQNGSISWCGPAKDLPENLQALPQQDLAGRLLTPSLIDCHTHIVHGGARAVEFEQRLTGVSYAEIAASGGGIVSTVSATRQASVDDLIESALPRVDTLLAEGVSVIEIKSGYGLDTDTELNMLRAARRIGELRPVQVKTSFLGAHALPAEYKDRADAYIDEVCIPALDVAFAEGLVDAVDGFCESIAFNTDQIERVFARAKTLGLPVKLHAEQLTLSGGTELAARYGALSIDHLEYVDEAGVVAMANAQSVAVLLPGAFYTLREEQLPPVELFRQHGVPIAIATDCNPGSSPLTSLLLAMNMACTLFRLTPEEALTGVTRIAAQALGLQDRGVIAEGMAADLAIWDVAHPAELSYRIGFNPLHQRLHAGRTAQ